MRTLWPRWTLLPPLPFFAYGTVVAIRGDLRWEHLAELLFVPTITYWNAWTKRFLIALYPIGLVSILYDGMRYLKNLGVSPERVHDCDLRVLELRLFGFTAGGERITLGDWFLTHHSTALDLYCAVPYGAYIFAVLGVAVLLYFRDYQAMRRFCWVFLLMNAAAYVTYHVYPAAPPWYYHAHGCEISMTALPSAGPRLTHVDAVLGISYFKSLYSRSSDLYGAVPSLHVAYPLLILVEGWRSFRWPLRSLSFVFFLSMGFAAVYLDHHWVVDVMLGAVYCLGSIALVRFVDARFHHVVAPRKADTLALDARPES